MNKLSALLNLFRKGSMVADPAAWKKRHITAAAVAGVLVAVSQTLEAFGYGHYFPVDAETAAVLAAAILVVADWVFVPVTTDKIGLGVPPNGNFPPIQAPGPDQDLGPDPRA